MRVVLDTNVVVSALIFRRGRLVRMRDLWSTVRIRPLTDRTCTEELLRVLAYPKFRLEPGDITLLLDLAGRVRFAIETPATFLGRFA